MPLSDETRANICFKTSGYADHYDTLSVKVVDRKQGTIDVVDIKLLELIGMKKSPSRTSPMDRYIRNDLFFISDTLRKCYEAQSTGLSSETELRPVSSALICRHCPLKGVPASVYNVNVWVTASSLLFAGYVNILEEVNDVTTEPSSKEGIMIDIMLMSLLQNR